MLLYNPNLNHSVTTRVGATGHSIQWYAPIKITGKKPIILS